LGPPETGLIVMLGVPEVALFEHATKMNPSKRIVIGSISDLCPCIAGTP
jgi:hypothetical protein